MAALAVPLVVLGVPLLWMMVDATADCRLNNLKHRDYTYEVRKKIRETGPGRIDMRALSSTFDRVCIVTISEPGQLYLTNEVRKPGMKLLGRNVCEQRNKQLVAFALITDNDQEKNYVLATWQFEKLLESKADLSGDYCGFLDHAIIECKDNSSIGGGNRCYVNESD